MEIPKLFSSKNIWSMLVIFFVVLSALAPGTVFGAFLGKGIRVTVDDELNVRMSAGQAYFHFKCDGDTVLTIKDGGTGDTNPAAGIIGISSTSTNFKATSGGAGCDTATTEAFTVASVSFPGYVHSTAIAVDTYSGTASTSVGASLSFSFKIGAVENELGNSLTLVDGNTASASVAGYTTTYNAAAAAYIPIPVSAGAFTLTVGADGYKNRTIESITTASRSQATAHFDGEADAGATDWATSGLLYAAKLIVGGLTRFGESVTGVGRTVTAGDNSATSCTDNNDGSYYCAVPLADTGVIATVAAFGGLNLTRTCTYDERTVASDAQSTCSITATESSGAGSGGGTVYEPILTPTPESTPTPEATPVITPTPIPGLSPTPTPVSATLYRKANDPKVYVQGSDGTLSWVKTIEEFNTAGYKWSDVQVISGEAFAKLNVPSSGTVSLFRKANDPKVYAQGSDGTLSWVKTIEAFNAAGYSWADVKMISGEEFGKMRVGGSVRIVKGIAFLRVRSGPSTANNVVGQVLPDQELKFTEVKNGWYHINSGWVSGVYAKEF